MIVTAGERRALIPPPAQHACISLISVYDIRNEGFTTVAPTLGVRPGCSQCCTPSYVCLFDLWLEADAFNELGGSGG